MPQLPMSLAYWRRPLRGNGGCNPIRIPLGKQNKVAKLWIMMLIMKMYFSDYVRCTPMHILQTQGKKGGLVIGYALLLEHLPSSAF